MTTIREQLEELLGQVKFDFPGDIELQGMVARIIDAVDEFCEDTNDAALMKKALLSVEWINPLSSVEYSPEHDWCPWCHRELKIGHSKNCPRQIALGISYESPASDSMRKLAEKVVEWEKQNPARTIPDLAADDLAASVAGVADIPARREEDDLNKLDEA